MGRRSVLLLALAFVVLPVLSAARAPAAQEGTLEIATKSGVRVFSVELAVTDEERAKGLMFRKELPVAMWMQNTYVSLDMIFIRDDGRIARIAESTEVLSERVIPSGVPVRAVLEVVAGTAKKLGIAPGDRVAHPLFGAR